MDHLHWQQIELYQLCAKQTKHYTAFFSDIILLAPHVHGLGLGVVLYRADSCMADFVQELKEGRTRLL